jgi:Ca2+-binding EF-hand superfamily protein
VNITKFLILGDNTEKLGYAFELYDSDNNGTLDRQEIETVLYSMLDMLGASKTHTNMRALVNESMKGLDASGDGLITKGNLFNTKIIINTK